MKYQIHIFFVIMWALIVSVSSAFLDGLIASDAPLKGRWILTHVLTQDETSENDRLIQHLIGRPRLKDYEELVVLSQAQPRLEKALEEMGYHVKVQSWKSQKPAHEEFNHPFYFLTSPNGQSFFAGNYTKPDRDFVMIQEYFKTQSTTWLPLWSCNQALNVANLFTPHLIVGNTAVRLPQVD